MSSTEEYELVVSKKQLRMLMTACEEYFRLRLDQWIDFVNEVSGDGWDWSKDDPNFDKSFNDYIQRRNSTRDIFKLAMRTASPRRKRLPKTDAMLIAEDLWAAIRHQLYLDEEGEKNQWDLRAADPLNVGPEPLPLIRRINANHKD